MLLRILFSVVLLFSVLFLPFWVSVILGLAGMVYFPLFLEAVVLFFLSDLLYGAEGAGFVNTVFISLIFSVAFLILIEFIKKKLKFYV